jgi:hypothetical protein
MRERPTLVAHERINSFPITGSYVRFRERSTCRFGGECAHRGGCTSHPHQPSITRANDERSQQGRFLVEILIIKLGTVFIAIRLDGACRRNIFYRESVHTVQVMGRRA